MHITGERGGRPVKVGVAITGEVCLIYPGCARHGM